MPRGVCEEGDLCSIKSGLKRKIVDIPALLLFKLRSSFLHEERGGSEAPTRRMAHWGLHVKIHTTSLSNKLQAPRVCFLRLLLHSFLYGPYVHEWIETGSKISTEKNIDDFTYDFTWCKRSSRHSVVWASLEKKIWGC
jgi:hypothetical protein